MPDPTKTNATRGRGWARAGFGFGVSASLAANVENTLRLPHAPLGAVLAASYWPLALLITLEIMARVSWPAEQRYWLLRYLGLYTVATIAAFVSYTHMSALLRYYGEDAITAHLGPFSVDGLMVVSATALLAIADNLKRHPVPVGRLGAVS
jgi:hypothetical protein